MFRKLAAECFGTFWLVFGGCGSAVLAAGFPELGIGFAGVALAFGLTVLTMAFAVGHISGGHFNPAVTIGLWAGGRFPAKEVVGYVIAQVVGGIVAAALLYLIASGKTGFDAAASGFASNGYGEHSPGGYSMLSALVVELVLSAGFLLVIHGATDKFAPAGFAPIAIGLSGLAFLQHATEASEYTLILLLFLVGIQLRNNGMTLKQIVLNRRGMIVAVVVVASSLIGGLINAFILDLPINTALAMASGFGWYSLSGILLTESFGPVIGSAAFFNDLARELIAIMLIPGLIRRSRSTALGLCGATSMDFTLPVLQRTGGLDMVPAAIVHGFILSLLVPILIAFFSA